jgi:DNA repair protein RadC
MELCIRDLEPSQRPRERLLELGPQALADAELLAVLLRTGRPGRGAIGEAQELLRDSGGVAGLARLGARDLVRRPGLGPAKAATLVAALELSRRLAYAELSCGERLDRPEAAGRFLVRHLGGRRTEVFGFLTLDGRHNVVHVHELSRGTRRFAPVDTGELFRLVLLDGAAALLLFHNHPSGVLDPSRDDLELTRRLVGGGRLVGADVVDHLIIGGTRWVSLRTVHPELFATSEAEP